MSVAMFFSLFGGLGLFIYGMKQMSDGLQKAAGKNLKKLLGMLTNNRIAGLLVGTIVTAVIQSSSATTVMVVGFVNAGLMTLAQSIGVIMGANIGTTVTAQLIAFNVSHYALHAVAIGAALYLFSKQDKSRQLGQIVLGFGILFLGLTIMKDTMKPLKDSALFIEVMERFGHSPLLGLLLGTAMTIILQSSSASIGILISLLSVGIINYWVAVPILLGGNIGTTITAILSSIGANKTAKRAAAAHFIFNFIGASLVVVLFYIIPDFADKIYQLVFNLSTALGQTPSSERLLANTHTLFNILNTLLWLPLVGFMVELVKRVIPGEDMVIKRGLNYLDERMLETPGLIIDQLKLEVLRMYDISQDMVHEAAQLFVDYDQELAETIRHKEEVVNELEEELITFMTKIPRDGLGESDIKKVDMYYAIIDDIESIADDAYDITELAMYKKENKINFSSEALATLNESLGLIFNLLKESYEMLAANQLQLAEKILEGEKKMDKYQIKHRNGHMKRLGEGICNPNAGIVYLEVLDTLEHISDQMADITHSILETK